MTRREFVTGSMLCGVVLDQGFVRAAKARAQAAAATANLFNIEKVADDVYAATAKPVALLNCNAAIFVNENDILVVDSHSKPSAAAALVAQIKCEVTPKPVRYIVNSHFHWDHTQGMPHYRTAAPHADVVASSATRRLIESSAVDRLKASMDTTRADLENLKRQAPKTDAERAYRTRTIAEMESYLREMQGYQPDLPNITFDDGLVIRDKNHELLVAFRGRGHTAGDVVVFSPQKKVIATGDQLHGFVPWLDDGYPAEWPATLRKYGELDFRSVIGGHGPVQNTRERLGQTSAYIEEITDAVRRGKQSGKNAAELGRTITPPTLRSLTRTNYGKFIEESLGRFWPLKPGESAADQLATQVKGNVDAIFKKV